MVAPLNSLALQRSHRLGLRFCAIAFAMLGLTMALGCQASSDVSNDEEEGATEDPLTSVTDQQRAAAQSESLGELKFDHLTPTGEKMMHASRWWMHEQDQDPRYPRPRMCASNVSKVLFLSGITRFDQEGVRALLGDIGQAPGARVIKLPRTRAELAAKLQTIDNGHIPAGMLVAGLNVHTSKPGDQHIGVVGHTDPDGTVWAYHNNWYRPENEGGQRKPYMISDANLRRGFLRQWMATPWLRITRDASGKITDVKSLLPAVDDMDPLNAEFQVTISIIPEHARELAQ